MTTLEIQFFYGDLSDTASLLRIVDRVQPDEIYNLAAQSHVKVSFDLPEYTTNIDGLGILRLLEAIRAAKLENKVRVFQAMTSDVYDSAYSNGPQDENTPFYPRSPYG